MKVCLIVLDSLGVGALPDAAEYGDKGANTLGHIVEKMPWIQIPNLLKLGLGNIEGMDMLPSEETPSGSFGKCKEASVGKDTLTGHWEITGVLTQEAFQTFPKGFPEKFMVLFEEEIGTTVLGNYVASGTEIIKDLGEKHAQTGYPIVYTSADSVFQIAANTEIIPLDKLYEICETARRMLVGEYLVGRVIARPFVYENGEYIRTSDRKDYAVSPSSKTLLDYIIDAGKKVYGVGKINDIFNGQGISDWVHIEDNMDGVDQTIQYLKEVKEGFIMTNLVDFDMKYGHRRDPIGYGKAIEAFDARIPEILDCLEEDDILMLCADHGNDPVHEGTDHTREYVPLLVYGKKIKAGAFLGTRETFADIGATIADFLETDKLEIGKSFRDLL